LEDLIDGYGYDSPPETPRTPTAPQNGLPENSVTPDQEEHEKKPPDVPAEEVATATSTVEDTPLIDIDPLPSKEMSKPPETQPTTAEPSALPRDDSGSFLTDVLKAIDSKVDPASLTISPVEPPASSTTSPQDSAPKSPAISSINDPSYNSSNYWAQMRANLKTRTRAASVTQDMSRTASGKTDESIASSNESSRFAKPNLPSSSDGRSGSFTSYTPLPPKFAEPRPRRPSSPGSGLPGVRYGRLAGPTIDTSGRTMSLTDAPRGGSGFMSDMKRPVFDGRSSNPSSPVMGNAPFSPNGGGVPRPSSRNRNREEDVIAGKLPVFAPRDGLPEVNRSMERGPRPQSPARGASPTPLSQNTRVASPTPRPLNTVRVASPTPPPARPQSPAGGTKGVSPARNIIPLGPDTRNQSASLLKESPPVELPKETLIGQSTARTPSPLHYIPEEKETQEKELPAPRTPSPVKPALVKKDTQTAVNLPVVPPKDSLRLVSSSSQPPPISQSVSSQPISLKPEKLEPESIIPIAIPAHEPEIDRNESPSPDPEWREEEEEEQIVPVDKRTTVFLQEASRKKDSLPPLPTELPPQVPQVQRVIASDEPLNVEKKVASPPPSASGLESRLPGSATDSSLERSGKEKVVTDLRESNEPMNSRPVSVAYPGPKQDKRDFSPPPVNYPSPKRQLQGPPGPNQSQRPQQPAQQPPRPTHKKNASSGFSAFSWRSHRSQASSSRVSGERPRTPSNAPPSASDGSDVHSSPAHRLPELDVLRPITWGPLAFAADASSPGQGQDVPEVPSLPVQNNLEKEEIPPIPKDYLRLNFGDQGESRHPEPLDLTSLEVTHETPAQSPESSAPGPSEVIPDKEMEATAPPASESEHDVPIHKANKGKLPQVDEEEQIPNTEAMSSDGQTDAESIIRSKYVDRDITSFIASDHVIHNTNIDNTSRPSTPRFADLLTLQIPRIPEEPFVPAFSTETLPDFMSGRDIPEMSTVAQRIGAYQSRREQMIKTDTGLRAWLLHVQTIRKPDLPQRIDASPPWKMGD
jgi:hypothetical protein